MCQALLYVLSNLIHIGTIWGMYDRKPHFTDGETKAQRGHWPEMAQCVGVNPTIHVVLGLPSSPQSPATP